ncbi:hypothetical protein [Anabaenopsis arnoldii]|uniref:Uncharacterized protein n=1 Tax=Anabaenopsis arnoldii TaxID=2152938 RepID=A0ABT5ANY0_9CYAN|nr:hypothetical protein [Anabaenopsis arnoldii]MDB9538408.1 hypothetical protein [Anabaenopsis arnoldii]MDH6090675.1 hypothetical protein [Anabaenopsis arnoldii]
MNFMDGLLLTLLNTIICITLPAFVCVITNKGQNQKVSKRGMTSPKSSGKISRAIDAA